MRLSQEFWVGLREEFKTLKEKMRPKRGFAGAETAGRVQIRYAKSGEQTGQTYSRLAGPTIPDNAEIVLLPFDDNDFIVLGPIQNGSYVPPVGGLDAEGVRDVIAAALVAGSNVTITPNDGADTITISSTGGGGGTALILQNSGGTVDAALTTLIIGSGLDITGAVAGTKTVQLGAHTQTASTILNNGVNSLGTSWNFLIATTSGSGTTFAFAGLDNLADTIIAASVQGHALMRGASNWENRFITIADITSLQSELDGKAASTHQHVSGGSGSVAIGTGASAAGLRSVAIGDAAGVHASATDGEAIGSNAFVGSAGINAVALGAGAFANGDRAMSIGIGTSASGLRSTAIGANAQAQGEHTTSLGSNTTVPSTSPRSTGVGYNADVPASTPDLMVLKANSVRIERSLGTGETSLVLYSADGTVGIITVTDADGLQVNGIPIGGGGGSEATTVADTATVDLVLTGTQITANVIGSALTGIPMSGVTSLEDIINFLDANIDNHIANLANPHAVTKSQVGLANVDNTSDTNKPVSTAQQTALNLKQNNSWEVKVRLAASVSTTLATAVNLTGLTFNVAVGEVWAFDVYLRVVGNAGGMKHTWTVPAGVISKITTGNLATVSTFTTNGTTASGSFTTAFNTGLFVGFTEIHGTFAPTAAGTVQFQFASVTAGQTTSVEIGSYMIAHRIS